MLALICIIDSVSVRQGVMLVQALSSSRVCHRLHQIRVMAQSTQRIAAKAMYSRSDFTRCPQDAQYAGRLSLGSESFSVQLSPSPDQRAPVASQDSAVHSCVCASAPARACALGRTGPSTSLKIGQHKQNTGQHNAQHKRTHSRTAPPHRYHKIQITHRPHRHYKL